MFRRLLAFAVAISISLLVGLSARAADGACRDLPATGIGVFCNDLAHSQDGPADPDAEAARMADVGVSFVVYYSHAHGNPEHQRYDLASLQALARHGIKAIVCPFGNDDGTQWEANARVYASAPNLIGWYVFDEPSGRVSLETQERVIGQLKAVRDLPCYTADNAWSSLEFHTELSPKYDHIFPDHYLQVHPITAQALVGFVLPQFVATGDMHRLSPALGAYEPIDAPERPEREYVAAWTRQLDFYPCRVPLFFLWNNNPAYAPPSRFRTIGNSASLRQAVKDFRASYRPAPQPAYVACAPRPQPALGRTAAYTLAQLGAIFGHPATTAKVRAQIGGSGLYLNHGDIAVIDLGAVRQMAVFRAKIVDPLGACSFEILRGDPANVNDAAPVATANPSGQATELTTVPLYELNSRYLIIRSTTPKSHNGYLYLSAAYIVAM